MSCGWCREPRCGPIPFNQQLVPVFSLQQAAAVLLPVGCGWCREPSWGPLEWGRAPAGAWFYSQGWRLQPVQLV